MRGWKISMSSSWKTPTSQTIQASGSIADERAERAADVPRDDRASAGAQDLEERRGRRLPVRPGDCEIGFGRSRAPSSSSSQTGSRARGARDQRASPRTPGLFTTRSIPCSSVSSSPPRWTSTPSRGAFPHPAPRSSRSRRPSRPRAGARALQPSRPARDRRRARACRRDRCSSQGRANCRKSR